MFLISFSVIRDLFAELLKNELGYKCYGISIGALIGATAAAGSGISAPLLKGVYLDHAVEIQANPATASTNLEFCTVSNGEYTFSGFEVFDSSGNLLPGKVIDLMIVTQAVQTEGFTNPDEALNTAYAAANTANSIPFLQNP